MSVIHLCDFCGTETAAGTTITAQSVSVEPTLTKRWKREGHTGTRHAHIQIRFGIDGINPGPDHEGHDLCSECRTRLLLQVVDMLQED